MKKTTVIKVIFWIYIGAYAFWFLNHHFLKLGITQELLNWIAEQLVLRVRDTLAKYSNELFFINAAALFAYVAKEIFWDVPFAISRAYNWKFITINKIVYLVSKAVFLPEGGVLHGLLVATYEGALKGNLFSDQPQPTEREKAMTDLARKVEANLLTSEQKEGAIQELRKAYANLRQKLQDSEGKKAEIHKQYLDSSLVKEEEKCSDESVITFFSCKEKWSGSFYRELKKSLIYESAYEELRDIREGVVEEDYLIAYLAGYEQRFREIFPNYLKEFPIDRKTKENFSTLKKAFPKEFASFIRLNPEDYLPVLSSKRIQDYQEDDPFLREFKKMKISGRMFKVWLTRFLNGDFD